MKWISVIVYSFSTWIVTSVLNGVGFAVLMAVCVPEIFQLSLFPVAVAGSLVFAVPAALVFFSVFVLAVLMGKRGQYLFRLLLVTSILLGVATAWILSPEIGSELKLPFVLLLLPPALSAGCALFVHRSLLIALTK